MKTKSLKLFIAACAILCFLPGCMNVSKVVKAAGEDHSSFVLDVQSGTVRIKYSRTNPGTNSSPHVLKDGEVEVKK